MKKKIDYEIGSGNVFADLGFPDAEEMLAKAKLAYQINSLIKKKKLNQTQAAELLDIDQPKISDLNKGKLAGFSFERLFRFLSILGQEITIKVSKARSKKKVTGVSVDAPYYKQPVIKRNQVSHPRALQAKKRK